MTLFRPNPAYATSPEVVELMGYAYFLQAGAPASNTIVAQQRTAVPQAATGQQLAQAYTVGPDARVVVVQSPSTVYHPAVAPNANQASIVMLDCRAFPADIIMAQAAYVPPPSATTGQLPALTSIGAFACLAIDNVNKFVYFACTNASGGAQTPANGASIQYDVSFTDTYTV
jgi:hypothetical protein